MASPGSQQGKQSPRVDRTLKGKAFKSTVEHIYSSEDGEDENSRNEGSSKAGETSPNQMGLGEPIKFSIDFPARP